MNKKNPLNIPQVKYNLNFKKKVSSRTLLINIKISKIYKIKHLGKLRKFEVAIPNK